MPDEPLAIETAHLTYTFPGSSGASLEDISLEFAWGSTNLLVGPNGAGKSTLLKILAGKTLVKKGTLKLGGFDPFEFSPNRLEQHNSDVNNLIAYLGTEWAANSVVKRDIPVSLLISSVGGDIYTERRDLLVKILDIDLGWSMLRISDGERRRVQICMGLLAPWRLLLLDEVTADLDVVVRLKLLTHLKSECVSRRCCVIYATHIFDGLGELWCDRIVHLNGGKKTDDVLVSGIQFTGDANEVDILSNEIIVPFAKSLHPLALHWLLDDLQQRGSR